MHHVTAFEHLFPAIGIGLLAGQQGPKIARWVLMAFPVGLAVGVFMGQGELLSTFIPVFNKTSFVVLGLLVAGAIRQPLWALVGLSFIFGVTHGWENGQELTGGFTPTLFLMGVSLAGLMIVAVVAAVVVSVEKDWQHIAIRVTGSWIAAIGLLFLAVA